MNLQHYAAPTVRIGIALVILWFGWAQLFGDTTRWVGYIPEYATALSGLSATTIVLLNGMIEMIFGTFLLLGLFTRMSAIAMSLHLAIIALELGWTAVAVRDWGLAAAALSTFFYGPDIFSLETKFKQHD